MTATLLRCKIHRATVTDCQIDYEGSLGIDREFMDMAGMLPNEKILVGNISNGNRFETYAIEEEAGSRRIRLNGAVAHLGQPGDLLVIMAWTQLTLEEARRHRPRILVLGDQNRKIVRLDD